MAQHADQPLPGNLFLFLQWLAHVGQQQQRVWNAILAEGRLTHKPPRRLACKCIDRLVGHTEQIFHT